jgi:hypothetical protein
MGLGGVLFFVWCQYQFGHWDLYLRLQRLGWGNEPNFIAIFDPRSYIPKLFFEDTTNSVCRASNLFLLALFFWVFRAEWLRRPLQLGKRIGLYFSATVMFFISLSGKANYNMDSMVRYNLPVFALLVLAIAQLYLERKSILNRWWIYAFWKWGYLLAIVVQLWMILLFTKGGWVA